MAFPFPLKSINFCPFCGGDKITKHTSPNFVSHVKCETCDLAFEVLNHRLRAEQRLNNQLKTFDFIRRDKAERIYARYQINRKGHGEVLSFEDWLSSKNLKIKEMNEPRAAL